MGNSFVGNSALCIPRSILPPIALLTDFGARDWFVGSMKAAMACIAPHSPVIDITHEIAPGDIRAGAFILRACCRDFPPGTVFVAVVDPGVGSARAPIAAGAGEYLFVGPDNGVLSWALDLCAIRAVHRIEDPRYISDNPSSTFHGRDIFAPVAAHLASGIDIEMIGPRISTIVRLDWPSPKLDANFISGSIVHIDRFGNAITSIEGAHLQERDPARMRIAAGSRRDIPLATFYQQVAAGKPLAIVGSAGLLEISINGGSAAKELELLVGDAIEVQWMSFAGAQDQ